MELSLKNIILQFKAYLGAISGLFFYVGIGKIALNKNLRIAEKF